MRISEATHQSVEVLVAQRPTREHVQAIAKTLHEDTSKVAQAAIAASKLKTRRAIVSSHFSRFNRLPARIRFSA
ncbi:hypothetical protein [Phormidesmis priestleyi]